MCFLGCIFFSPATIFLAFLCLLPFSNLLVTGAKRKLHSRESLERQELAEFTDSIARSVEEEISVVPKLR